MMNKELDVWSKDQDVGAVFASYLDQFDRWLEVNNCNDLRRTSDWETLYIILAKMTVEKCNLQRDEDKKINFRNIAIPRMNVLFQWCRLLYQGLVPLRIGVIDGQHRMCAIIKLLTRWSAIVVEKEIPPRKFELDDEKLVVDKRGEWLERRKFDTVLEAITAAKPTVRILVAETDLDIEEDAQCYSRERERSQSLKKQRNLVDV